MRVISRARHWPQQRRARRSYVASCKFNIKQTVPRGASARKRWRKNDENGMTMAMTTATTKAEGV